MNTERKPLFGFAVSENQSINQELLASLSRLTHVLDFTTSDGARYFVVMATLEEIAKLETKVGRKAIRLHSQKEGR